ncbi:putative MFS transporter [Coniochaeta hoffmannii]|uniref:MFS transporter n=1 Tax=Coniochaeta hoffmannii TaxID=91930 RepID=A0AA38RJH7_9PEZI|nr:putative MFS transporter [Coniochaeta hoffmannii]
MSADFPAPMDNADVKSDYPRDAEKELNLESATTEPAIDAMSEVLLDIDPVMSRKMHLVNNTLDEVGWTRFHMKLSCLNGFGHGVDSLQVSLQGIIAGQAAFEFSPSYARSLTIALYTGMLLGALFWGSTADIIGRRFAFNVSLFVCSAFTIVAGAAPSWNSLAFFVAFAKYVPHNKQWLITWLAAWWGVGCMIDGFVAWGFMPNFSCPDRSVAPFIECTRASNMGWRYVFFTIGALIFVLSVLRVTIIRLKETSKFLLGQGRDAELVKHFQGLAARYNRPCSLTLAKLEACGTISTAHKKSRWSLGEFFLHVSSLFSSTKVTITSVLLILSWMMIDYLSRRIIQPIIFSEACAGLYAHNIEK